MTAYGALSEDDQAARQDVRPFDGDHDRYRSPADAQVVARSEHDALAGVYVHRVIRDRPGDLRTVILEDGRGNRRLLARIHRGDRHGAGSVADVGVTRHPRHDFLNAFEVADGHAELLANPGIGTG